MPYYMAGDYYQGDYYQAGGIFGSIGKFLGKAAKTVAGTALSLTPAGGIAKALIPSLSGGSVVGTPRPLIPVPGLTGIGQRLVPGGASGFMLGGGRRRMNVTNVKALRRAGRRVRGFLKLARRLGALPVGTSGKKLFKKSRRRA